MALEPGQSLLHYRVIEKIGAGGMGVVWKALDTTLDREVAIKSLPAAFAEDPERMARFEREAKTLASLNHPGIAGVYGLHQADGVRFIAMELVVGEDLSERLVRGPLPQERALEIARQIATALEAAHEAGIIHRDLKPANIRLTPDGQAKVLDFGLAKALSPAEAASGSGVGPAHSPTMTHAATTAGMILGTAAYMAPEQARGKPVDRRADIWAFGCVLYEMLSGRAPFEGEDVSELLAHVITQEPDFAKLPAGLPPRVDDLVRRCLRKEPRVRLPHIAAARIALDELDAPGNEPPAAKEQGAALRAGAVRKLVLLATVAGIVMGALLAWWLLQAPAGPPLPAATHFELVLDPPVAHPLLALSPDGGTLAYTGRRDGKRHLYLRDLDRYETTQIPGSEGGHAPAFSPDGSGLVFFTAGRLKRTRLPDGQPESLCGVPGTINGVDWTRDGQILFASGSTSVPWRIPAAGGTVEKVQVQDLEPGAEVTMPAALPGGDAFVAVLAGPSLDGSRIVSVELSDGRMTVLTRGTNPRFIPPGHLFYQHAGRAMLVPFDPERRQLTGPERPAPLDEPASHKTDTLRAEDAVAIAIAGDGTLVYTAGRYARRKRMLWLDRDGGTAETGQFGGMPRLSPAGDRALATDAADVIRMFDLKRKTSTQVIFSEASAYPLWSPDGTQVYHSNNVDGEWGVYTTSADGRGKSERLPGTPRSGILTSVGSDGTLMGYAISAETSRDIWVCPPGGEVESLLATAANERAGVISPAGGVFAYVSDEEGTDRIYLRELPDSGRRWPVTQQGGLSPVWSRDGRELFFRSGDSILAVSVNTDGALRVGEAREIFASDRLDLDLWGNQTFDSAPDGRLLVSVVEPDELKTRVVLGWGKRLGRIGE